MTTWSAALVPFSGANPETQAAYLAGLRQRGYDDNPEVWHCNVCGEEIDGQDILISYDVPTPIPFCTTETGPSKSCAGHGPDLVPAPTKKA